MDEKKLFEVTTNYRKEINVIASIYNSQGERKRDKVMELLELGLEDVHFNNINHKYAYCVAVDKCLDNKLPSLSDLPEPINLGDLFDLYDPFTFLSDAKDLIQLYQLKEKGSKSIEAYNAVIEGRPAQEVDVFLEKALNQNSHKHEEEEIKVEDYYGVPESQDGVLTGYGSWDRINVRFLPGHIYAVGADTGAGKTTFVINLLARQVAKGNKVLIFSIEQPKQEIYMKFLTLLSGYSETAIRQAKCPREVIEETHEKIQENVIIVHDSSINSMQMTSISKKYCAKDDISVIAVDYWQLSVTNEPGTSNFEKLNFSADKLLMMARSINKPVIVIGQVDKASSQMTRLGRNSFSGSKQLSNNSSYVFMIQKEEDETVKSITVEIAKSRKPNHRGQSLTLNIDQNERLYE